AGLIAFLCLWPAQFTLEARGTLAPVQKRDVFTAIDGLVDSVSVEPADTVQAGKTLIELKNTDLDVAAAKVRGDIQTTREGIQSADRARKDAVQPEERDRISGEQ